MAKILCEPILQLPHKFDIEKLRIEGAPYFAARRGILKNAGDDEDEFDDILTGYNILPTSTHQEDYLKKFLSLQKNDYMRCSWLRFLNNRPDKWVRISLYADIPKKPEPVRRMQLNGKFYVRNILAPIPYSPDPRFYEPFANIPSKNSVQTNKKE